MLPDLLDVESRVESRIPYLTAALSSMDRDIVKDDCKMVLVLDSQYNTKHSMSHV